jgi:hypothetical protein
MGTLVYRAIGAAALDASTYETVEGDRPATRQALIVVIASSLAAGVGAGGLGGPRLPTLAVVAGAALVLWLGWAALIHYVGGVVMPERGTRVTYGELVRTIGFSTAPGLLQALAIFPVIRTPAFVLAWAWMLVAMVVAVRHALDFRSIWHAVGVCVVTLAIVLATAFAVSLAFDPTVA